MKPLTEQEIRTAFVNCTKGEAKRLTVPRDLAEQCWGDLDFLGWRDPQAPDRAYLVTELDGSPVGVQLRSSDVGSWQMRRSMCSVCVTTHTGGVSLMVAPRSGKAGQQGNSVGVYMCSDLACSLGSARWSRACPWWWAATQARSVSVTSSSTQANRSQTRSRIK
ncbi:FBP domain-containing protein [Streptomyces sp. NPDC048473]|uniref:FBP domain-containing protein n=1 Tax=unclassified Streptomyces TaxID=2593676 RepID=UPI003711B69E